LAGKTAEIPRESFLFNEITKLFVSCACCQNQLTTRKGPGGAAYWAGQPKSGLLEDENF
jgi:hypothetical protein